MLVRKNYNIIFIILIIFIAILILYLNLSIFGNVMNLIESKEFEANVIVANRSGFDLNTTALKFGMVMPGGAASRTLTMKNDYKEDVKIFIYGKGKIKDLVIFSEEFLKKGESKEIKVSVSIPQDTSYGLYDGKIIFNIRKV